MATEAKKARLNRIKRVAVEGNIAVGKSTFISLLEEESSDWAIVGEPLSRWQNVQCHSERDEEITLSQKHGGNLLDMFYSDPRRWAFTFQSYVCLSRMRHQLKPAPGHLETAAEPVVFYERSVYSDRYCFAANCFSLGTFNETEWNIYCDWHSTMMAAMGELKLDGIIYLRAEPEVCLERLKLRGRPEERPVSLEYLDQIHTRHESWLVHKEISVSDSLKGAPILTMDCNLSFQEDTDKQNDMMSQVKAFVAGL
ncbi:deoxycytidine kinase-like isoform X1 [Branchiostoma floridae]|uniref:deoxyguanosine kinase n=1 Tax=Branchiostoma floridae TaxID=7739 RepID=A0A9J7KSZ4_BRAFL|nr:deoxycytidine kinase-like isoform X1 [Branchiostoma floridae]